MAYKIRPTIAADLDTISAIYADAVTHGTASFELTVPTHGEMFMRFETLSGQGFPFLSLLEGDTLKGYAYAGPYRARPAYRWCVENSIYLDASARGKGYGKALLVALIEECTKLGFRQMVAVIGDSANKGSVGVHAATGFAMVGTLKDMGWKHGKWLDTVLMQVALGDGADTPADENSLPGAMFNVVKTG